MKGITITKSKPNGTSFVKEFKVRELYRAKKNSLYTDECIDGNEPVYIEEGEIVEIYDIITKYFTLYGNVPIAKLFSNNKKRFKMVFIDRLAEDFEKLENPYKVGDKVIGVHENVGKIFEVENSVDCPNNVLRLKCIPNGNYLHIYIPELLTSYEPYEEDDDKKDKSDNSIVSSDIVNKIINDSDIIVKTVFGKTTVVACKLPSGFVIVESSSSVSTDNYDEEIGRKICMERIKDKIWEHEAYKYQSDRRN